MKKPDLFKEVLPSILQNKREVFSSENEKEYLPFMVNKALSYHLDCILQSNEMNVHHDLDKLLQYHFLLNSIRGYKRAFQKWQKRDTSEEIDAIKEYYSFSNEKAKEALRVLAPDQVEEIIRLTQKGGAQGMQRKDHGK